MAVSACSVLIGTCIQWVRVYYNFTSWFDIMSVQLKFWSDVHDVTLICRAWNNLMSLFTILHPTLNGDVTEQ